MSPYIIFDSNERQQTKCLPKNNTLKCQCPAIGFKGHGYLNVCEKKAGLKELEVQGQLAVLFSLA